MPATSQWIASIGETVRPMLGDLHVLSRIGLAQMYIPADQQFAYTIRGHRSAVGPRLTRSGQSVRYSAICALGIAAGGSDLAEEILGPGGLDSLVAKTTTEALQPGRDPGSIALAAWAAAEVSGDIDQALLAALATLPIDPTISVVELSWVVTAAVAACRVGADAESVMRSAVGRLIGRQGAGGLFAPYVDPSRGLRVRRHVGSFADQVYPIQALARAADTLGEPGWLERAGVTASAICALQGDSGQWWWHYDSRARRVVESYPVYSVHQHAMGPMALRDLAEVGGHQYADAAVAGLRWLESHPETMVPMIEKDLGVVWRKVGRREPRKLTRALAALYTSVDPRRQLPTGVLALFPPRLIDYECRPYELGWLLYAWRGFLGVERGLR